MPVFSLIDPIFKFMRFLSAPFHLRFPLVAALTSLVVFLTGAGSVLAQNTWNKTGTANWNTPGNWSDNAVPGAGTFALINTGGTSVIGVGVSATARNVLVGRNSGGTLLIDGGYLKTIWTGTIGQNFGGAGVGTVTVQNGGVWDAGGAGLPGFPAEIEVGAGGSAGFLNILAGGTVNANSIRVGDTGGGTGTLTMSGTLNVTESANATLWVGYENTGIYNQTSGLASLRQITVGSGPGVTGTATVNGGTMDSQVMIIGDTGTGTFLQNGGLVRSSAYVSFGLQGGTGTLHLAGGIFEAAVFQEIGGLGKIRLNGGTLRALGHQSNFMQDFEVGDVTVEAGGGFIDTNGYSIGISNAMTGAGRLTKQGTGNLTLTNNQFYTGGTTVKNGTLTLSGGDAILYNSANLRVADDSGNDATIAVTGGSIFSNVSTLGFAGSSTGKLTMSGGRWLDASTITIGYSGSGAVELNEGDITANGNVTLGDRGTGTGSMTVSDGTFRILADLIVGKAGSGNFVFNGGEALVQGVSIASETGGSGSATVNGGTVTATGVIAVGSNGVGSLRLDGGSISSAGAVLGIGTAGRGTAVVESGTWQIDGNLSVGIQGQSSLTIDGGLVTATGTTQLAASLTSGRITLTNASGSAGILATQRITEGAGSGYLEFNGGILRALGNESAFISGFEGGDLTTTGAGGTIDSGAFAIGIASGFSGTGGLTKVGTGTLTMSGVSTYSGTTSVDTGKLVYDGTNTGNSAVTVKSGAELAGSGSFSGTVTVADGGILSPGNSPGTITMGALNLNNASILNFELGTVSDRINVTGNLTLDGILNVQAGAGFVAGTYRLFNYGGTLTNQSLAFGSMPSLYDYVIQTSVANQVNLLVTEGNYQLWDGSQTTPDGTVNGGTGTWDNATTNWTNIAGTANSAWTGSSGAVFQGTAGTATIADGTTISAPSLHFFVDGYTVSAAGTGQLQLTDAGEVEVVNGATATISAPITSGMLTKTSTGRLNLTGANTYAGGTAILAGTLGLSGAGSLLSTGGVNVSSGATFDIAEITATTTTIGDLTGSGAVTLGSKGLRFGTSNNATFAGAISGTGGIEKLGTGAATLTGASNYTGTTAIREGVLAFNAGSISGNVAISGGELRSLQTTTLSGSTNSTGGVISAATGTTLTLNGPTVGNRITIGSVGYEGTVLQNISGGNNSYTLNIVAGSFQTTSGNLAASIAVQERGTLLMTSSGMNTYDLSGSGKIIGTGGVLDVYYGDFSGVISGTAGLRTGNYELETGVLLLTGENTYTGGSTLTGGSLQIGNGGTTGSIVSDVSTTTDSYGYKKSLIFNRSNDWTYGGSISGTGGVIKRGAGVVTLTGASSYENGTQIQAGTLALAGGGSLLSTGAVDIATGATFDIAGITAASTTIGDLTGSGAVTLGSKGLRFGTNNNATYAGAVSGTGGLTKDGSGLVTLSGESTYSGGTTITEGTLRATSVSALGADGLTLNGGNLELANDTGLNFGRNTLLQQSATIFSDRLTAGAGVTHTLGTLSIGGQTLNVERGANVTSGTAGLNFGATTLTANNATFDTAAGTVLTLGALSGNYSFTKQGGGTMVLSAPSARSSGATSLEGGTLRLENGSALWTGGGGNFAAEVGTLELAGDVATTFNVGSSYQVITNSSITSDRLTDGAGVMHTINTGFFIGPRFFTLKKGAHVTEGTAGLFISSAQVGSSFSSLDTDANTNLMLGNLMGSAQLSKGGAGTLTLSGANSFTGSIGVDRGTLVVNGTNSELSTVTVSSGATLAGTGSIGGTAKIEDGGILSPGNSPGTITLGGLDLENASIVNFELSNPAVIGGGVNDLIKVTNNLDLDGIFNFAFAPNPSTSVPSTYTLMQYGTLTGSASDVVLGNGLAGYNMVLNAADSAVTLTTTYDGLQFWDGANTTPQGVANGSGGNGTWNGTTTNWTNQSGSANTAWADLTAVFMGTAGTVDVASDVQVAAVQFGTDGYVLNGAGSIGITDANTSFLTDPNVTATIETKITGAGGLMKTGDGTLILASQNDYTGGTQILGGTVSAQRDSALGSGSVDIGATGTLSLGGMGVSVGGVSGSGTLDLNSTTLLVGVAGGDSFEFSGLLDSSGGGSFFKTGAGEQILSGTTTGAPNYIVTGGTLTLASATAANAATYVQIQNADALLKIDGVDVTIGRLADGFGSPGGVLIDGGSLTLSSGTSYQGAISGTGDLIFNKAAETLTLVGAKTYTGATKITNGTLALSGTGSIAASSGVSVASTGIFDISATTSGAVIKALTGAGGVALGSKALTIDSATDANFSGVISGLGNVTKQGLATQILSGANTYSGVTSIETGRLATTNASALGTSEVSLGGAGALAVGSGSTLGGVRGLNWADGGTFEFTLGALPPIVSIVTIDGTVAQTGTGVFAFADGGAFLTNTTYDLITFDTTGSVLTDWTANLVGNVSGTFVVRDNLDGTSTLTVAYIGGSSGPVINNFFPDFTPVNADFLVAGAVTALAGPQQVASLTFADGSSLTILDTLRVNTGNFTVESGEASISGGLLLTPGDFNKLGSGLLNVLSNIITGGNTNVASGILAINGQLTTQNVLVQLGAWLKGSGLINGNVINNGTVAPGNSPGTLTVNGNFTQSASGTLQIEVADNAFDQLIVTGQASLAGTLQAVAFGGHQFAYGDQVAFLQAGSISGNFDSIVMSDPSQFRGRFITSGGTGILLVAPTSYTLVAQNQNQTNVAKALDSFIGASGDRDTVSLALDLQTADQYSQAFDQIAPGFYQTLTDTVIEQTTAQNQMLAQRLSSVRLGTRGFNVIGLDQAALTNDRDGKGVMDAKDEKDIISPANATNWSVFVQGNGIFARVMNVSQVPNYRYNSGGFIVGADYTFGGERKVTKGEGKNVVVTTQDGSSLTLGLYTGYQGTLAKYANDGQMTINSALFGGYATYTNGGFYSDLIVGGAYNGYRVSRPIDFSTVDRTARSNPNGGSFSTYLDAGYDWKVGGFTFGPLLSAQYTYAGTTSFAETGADSLDLRVGQQNANSIRTNVGGRVAFYWQVTDSISIVPEGRMFWQHEYLNGPRGISASLDGGNGPGFGYTTTAPGRDSVFAGAGVSANFGDRWSTAFYYNADFGRQDFVSHMISASLGWKF